MGRAWVNQALADKGDDRLWAEVHRYQNLMDEADRKERELSTIQDCLMDISMDLRMNMQCLAEAEAIKHLEDWRAWTGHGVLIHLWQFKEGCSP